MGAYTDMEGAFLSCKSKVTIASQDYCVALMKW
jgi:hypothetical protein